MLTQNTGVIRSQSVTDLAEGDLAIQCVGSLRYFFSVLRYSELILICQQSCLYILCISFGCGQSDAALCTVGVGEYCFVNRCKLSALICFDDGLLNIQLSFACIGYFYDYRVNSIIIGIAVCFTLRNCFLKKVSISLACVFLRVFEISKGYRIANVLHGLILIGVAICFVLSCSFQCKAELSVCDCSAFQDLLSADSDLLLCLVFIVEYGIQYLLVLFAVLAKLFNGLGNIQCTVMLISDRYCHLISGLVVGIPLNALISLLHDIGVSLTDIICLIRQFLKGNIRSHIRRRINDLAIPAQSKLKLAVCDCSSTQVLGCCQSQLAVRIVMVIKFCLFHYGRFCIRHSQFFDLRCRCQGSVAVILQSYLDLIFCLVIGVAFCFLCRDILIQPISKGLSKILLGVCELIKGDLSVQSIFLSLIDIFTIQDESKLSCGQQTTGQILLCIKNQRSLCMVLIVKGCFLDFFFYRTACRTTDFIEPCLCSQSSITLVSDCHFYLVSFLIVSITFCFFCRNFLIHQISISLSCICFRVAHRREGNTSVCFVLNSLFVCRCCSGTLKSKGELILRQSSSGQHFRSCHRSFAFCLINVSEFQFRLFVVLFANINIQCTVTVITYFYNYRVNRTVIGITTAIGCRCNLLNLISMDSDVCGRVPDRFKFEASIFCVPCRPQNLAVFT